MRREGNVAATGKGGDMEKRLTEKEKIRCITDVIRGGYTERIHWQVGPEMEHFVFDRQSGKRVMYPGERGVEGILQAFMHHHPDWRATWEEGHLLALEKCGSSITLEPGAQLEFSLAPSESVLILQRRYQEMLDAMYEILDPLGYMLVAIGLDPFNKVDDIPLLPKSRYHMMDAYLRHTGDLARTMMRKSAALQVSLDIESDADFCRKYRVLTALSPILYTLFDSAVDNEGRRITSYNARQEIWRRTDPARTGFVPDVFSLDFGVESYADWVLSAPPIFLPKDGKVVSTGNRPLRDLLDEARDEEELDRFVRHGMSIVFPDVRAKQVLEIRMMDAVSGPYTFGAMALLKGLFYHSDTLDRLEERFTPMQADWVERGKNAGRDNGIQAYYHGDYFAHWGTTLCAMAREGLSEPEAALLAPLEKMWDNLDTPRLEIERAVEQGGWLAALRKQEVRHVLS